MKNEQLYVSSHVGRDLLQSASLYKSVGPAIWEYIVNSIQYVEPGTQPNVLVNINRSKKHIMISDNGRGMSYDDLNHFFKMHGENIERSKGQRGRGKFGTGKSAAFGIANVLQVDTVRNGQRNVVQLDRSDIEASDGSDIPIKIILENESTDRANGTIIIIEDILIKNVSTAQIIETVEMHLTGFKHISPQIVVNHHKCEYVEPEIENTYEYTPNDEEKSIFGDVKLIIKASKSPLSPEETGVSVYSAPGCLIGIERAGIENKDMANYIFGEITVPTIEEYETEIEPYTLTRDYNLNSNHPVVERLQPFIGYGLESARKDLVKKANAARKTEELKKFAEVERKIENVLNEDFAKLKKNLQDIQSKVSSPGISSASFGKSALGGESDDTFIDGEDIFGFLPVNQPPMEAEGKSKESEPPEIVKSGLPDEDGNSKLSPAGGDSKAKRRPSGGFRVEYRNMGVETKRSKYDQNERTILINLDHPLISAAKNLWSDSNLDAFEKLTYEIAFSEYALAIVNEMMRIDEGLSAGEGIYEIRDRLDKVSRLAVSLYK